MTTDNVRPPGRPRFVTHALARGSWCAVLLVFLTAVPGAAQVVDGQPFPLDTEASGILGRVTAATLPDGTIMTLLQLETPNRTVLPARAYSAAGVPLGPETRIATGEHVADASIAVRPGGGYVTTWRVLNRFDNLEEQQFIARFLDAAGVPVGAEVKIDEQRPHTTPAALGLPGRTVFAWTKGSQILGEIRFPNGELPIDFAIGTGGGVNDVQEHRRPTAGSCASSTRTERRAGPRFA
jgi:hypothetical protein